MDTELDNQESLKPEELQETLSPDTQEDVTEPISEELKKAKELAESYKIRAEKAERAAKKAHTEKETPKNEGLSLKDIRALQDVHDDDVDDLTDYAKYKKITIAEAKKTAAMIALLKAKEEERKTAQAANTGGGRRGTSQPSDEQVLSEALSGKEVDPEKFAEARHNIRMKKK